MPYFSKAVSWCSRCRHADRCRSTRPPARKYRLILFFFPFSVRSSLMVWSWLRFVTCVPQHMLLSTPSIVTTRTGPLWSSGNPLVLTCGRLMSSSEVLFQMDRGNTLPTDLWLMKCFIEYTTIKIITDLCYRCRV